MSDLNLLPLWSSDREGDDHAVLRIPRFPYAIGRGMNCDHRIDDPIVSRWHCVFSERDGHIWLVDLGSKNGTRLNGELVAEPRTLADGDTLAIAYYTYLVCLGEIPLEVPFDQCTVPRQQESSIRS